MKPVLDARGEDPDHALVPVGVEQGHARPRCFGQFGDRFERRFEHAAFDGAPLAVEVVELLGAVRRSPGVVGNEAFDAQAHVRQASCRVQARAHDEAEVEGGGLARIATGDLHQRNEAGLALAIAQAFEAMAHEDAVVGIQ